MSETVTYITVALAGVLAIDKFLQKIKTKQIHVFAAGCDHRLLQMASASG